MIATARSFSASRSPFETAVGWFRARPWVFAYAVLTVWALVPEIRRLIDFRFGYNSISVISIIPLLSLAPFSAALLYARSRKIDRAMATCAWLWFGGFTFSAAIGFVNGDKVATTYAYVGFVLPAVFGFWLASVDAPVAVLFDKISGFLLALATPIAIYGIFQFVAPPAWDRAWMEHANITSIGIPEPFLLRPFSTLNAPGPFADFLVVVTLFNLPRLARLQPFQVAQLTLLLGALALTSVRSAWLALAIGALAYIWLSPRRGRNLTVFIGIGLLGALLVFNASTLLGSVQAGDMLSQRFGSLTDLSHDQSYTDRQQYLGAALLSALAEPTGQGLGVVGTATKLTTGTTVDFDNGYVARLVEMGYFGTLCYLATLGAGLFLSFRYWRDARRRQVPAEAAIGASLFAIQLALAGLDISSDHHSNFAGVFFWVTLALASGRNALQRKATSLVA